jgi:hypothetical protein
MKEIKNLDCKRVCDISADKRTVEIRRKDCVTKITANQRKTRVLYKLKKLLEN